ncbi:hypothetical protein SAMN05444521_1768 [Streptomyces sp. 3214.6]|nr:hypothetical protein SAMN05444521_1768 [Streptomyces sp. 3214.6]
MCLHADQVKCLLRGGGGDAHAWRLVPRRRPLSPVYLAGIAAAVGTCVALPYGEELLRCVRAARARKHAGPDGETRGRGEEATETAGRGPTRPTSRPCDDRERHGKDVEPSCASRF